MKQGMSKNMASGQKREPRPHAVSVDRVSNIGLQQVRTKSASPMFKSEGYRAPGTSNSSHRSGSQGRH